MAHLAARSDIPFAIKRQMPTREQIPGRSGGILSDQIVHFSAMHEPRLAKRPAGHSANMVFELARHAGFGGPVSRIVHARSKLIGEQCAIGQDKEFQRQHTNLTELFSQARGQALGVAGDFGTDR